MSDTFTTDITGNNYTIPYPIGCNEPLAYPEPPVGNANVAWTDILGATKTGIFDEAARNTDPGDTNVKLNTAYKILNADKSGLYSNPDVVVDLKIGAGKFLPGATITLAGTGVKVFQFDTTGVSVLVECRKTSDDSLIATVMNKTADFTAGVARTWASINGSALTYAAPSTETNYYFLVTVSGGTPTLTTETSWNDFTVASAALVPSTPAMTVASDGTGTSFTATIDGDAGVTNYLYYKRPADTAWTLGGNCSGDGTIQVTGVVRAFYETYAVSKSGDSYSLPTVVLPVYVDTTAATAYIVQIMEAVRDIINAAALTDSGGDAITASIDIPPSSSDSASAIKIFPAQEETQPTNIGANTTTYRVSVALCERTTTTAAQNKNMRNAEIIRDTFVGKRLSLLPGVACVGSSSGAVAEENVLWQNYKWINVVVLEFPKLRDRL
jgi:hypothetical protein